MPSVLYIHALITFNLWGKDYYPHFMDEQEEAPYGGWVGISSMELTPISQDFPPMSLYQNVVHNPPTSETPGVLMKMHSPGFHLRLADSES